MILMLATYVCIYMLSPHTSSISTDLSACGQDRSGRQRASQWWTSLGCQETHWGRNSSMPSQVVSKAPPTEQHHPQGRCFIRGRGWKRHSQRETWSESNHKTTYLTHTTRRDPQTKNFLLLFVRLFIYEMIWMNTLTVSGWQTVIWATVGPIHER